ncbi:hypothetical protein ACYOEI_01545 [Singulisphaera rosea]
MTSDLPEVYQHEHLVAQRQLFKLAGAAFWLKTPDGRVVAYSKQKAFKLKEDIRVFADEAQTVELLSIKADRIVDFSAAYTVVDSQTGETIGALRRKGLTSLVRDSWELFDSDGVLRGRVFEESPWKALVRRFVEIAALLLPQTFLIQVEDETVATMRQNAWGIPPKFTVDLTHDAGGKLPRPMAIATVVLLLAVEGRQR